MTDPAHSHPEASADIRVPLGTAAFTLPDFSPASSYWLEHIPFAFWLVEHARPSTLVELGVHTGGSYCNFCQAVELTGSDCRCFGIDNFEGDPHYQSYGPEILATLKAYHDPRYKGFSNLIKSNFAPALGHFEDGSIDLLHIDGTHFYEDVREDYELWKPKLSDKAVVLFHDTNVHERNFGVYRLWKELTAVHPGFEFLHCNGLGVLVPGESPSPALTALVHADDATTAHVRRVFAALGDRITRKAVAPEIENRAARAKDLAQDLQTARSRSDELAQSNRELTRAKRRTETETRRNHDALETARTEAATRRRQQALEQIRASRTLEIQRANLAADPAQTWTALLPTSRNRKPESDPVADSGLFDTRFYLSQLPPDTRVTNPLQHYREKGWLLGLRPNPLFDPLLYAATHQLPSGCEPLHDYVTEGHQAGRAPHPLFDAAFYLASDPSLASHPHLPFQHFVSTGLREKRPPHPLFDQAYYTATYPDITLELAMDHFLHTGCWEGRRPHPLFDTTYYLRRHRDLIPAMENPVAHYLENGHKPNFSPHPLFDPDYYLTENDLRSTDCRNLLLHYLANGAKHGYDPHPLFNTKRHISQNPHLKGSGINALLHFCTSPASEFTSPHPLFDGPYYRSQSAEPLGANPLVHFARAGGRDCPNPHPLFDTAYYLSQPSLAKDSDINPLVHFATGSGLDKPSPHPLFDSEFYLRTYADVATLELNPLMHYLGSGATEDRMPNEFFETLWYQSKAMRDAPERLNPLVHFALCPLDRLHDPGRFFQIAWYLETYPDVAKLDINPLVHFLLYGKPEDRKTCKSAAARARLERKYPGITKPIGIASSAQMRDRMRKPVTRMVPAGPRPRFTMLFPDLDANLVFGGYISAFEFLAALSASCDIRLVSTVQAVQPGTHPELCAKFAANPRISAMLARADIVDCSQPGHPIDVHPLDVFCTYSVWDGFICSNLAAAVGQSEFIHFIQEDEAIFRPNDSYHAVAREAQKLPAFCIFNTDILREHFRLNRLGPFADREETGLANSTIFQHALVDTLPPSVEEMRQRDKTRVLIYARPEDHAKRNLFEIVILGIERFIENHPDAATHLEFTGVGSMFFEGDLPLPGGHQLHIKPKLPYADYAKSLAGFDIGISLMYAPHPSILPFEMASAGQVVVTNRYGSRDTNVIEAISPNLIAIDPTPSGIEAGLLSAVEKTRDHEARVRGADFPWSRSWQQSFNPDFLAKVETAIKRITRPA